MNPDNKRFLDEHFHHFLVLERAFYIRGLSGNVRSEMQRIMSEEFIPNYTADLWCPVCISDMVKLLYTKYHEWLRAQLNDTKDYIDISDGIEVMRSELLNKQINQEIAEVKNKKASFPSNK